jgi:hypothetical protein
MPAELQEIDLRARLKPLYTAKKAPALIEVPVLRTLMIDGAGAPAAAPFQAAVQALYTCAYTVKFHAKSHLGLNWPVMPFEGLWFAADGGPLDVANTDAWAWQAFIVIPGEVTPELLESVLGQCVAKARGAAKVRVQDFAEGRCAQVLHVGPYDTEPATVSKLMAFIAEQGLRAGGKHHEIYLGDPRRSAPEKLRTIIRYAVSWCSPRWQPKRGRSSRSGSSEWQRNC